MTNKLTLEVRSNGHLVAAFVNRTDAEFFALERSENRTGRPHRVTYEVVDTEDPRVSPSVIRDGAYVSLARMAE